jgi:hypothetical protein
MGYFGDRIQQYRVSRFCKGSRDGGSTPVANPLVFDVHLVVRRKWAFRDVADNTRDGPYLLHPSSPVGRYGRM